MSSLIASDAPNMNRNGNPPKIAKNRSSVPPSESAGAGAYSDMETGFADDEVVGARGTDRNRPRDPMARAVPRVVDRVGEKVAEEFEAFLEGYVFRRAFVSIIFYSRRYDWAAIVLIALQIHR